MPFGGVENAAPAACPACPEPAAGQDRSLWTHVDPCYSAEAPWPDPAATQDGELVLRSSPPRVPSKLVVLQPGGVELSLSLLIGTLSTAQGASLLQGLCWECQILRVPLDFQAVTAHGMLHTTSWLPPHDPPNQAPPA